MNFLISHRDLEPSSENHKWEDCTSDHTEAAQHRLKYESKIFYHIIWKSRDDLHEMQKGRATYLEGLLASHEQSQKLK